MTGDWLLAAAAAAVVGGIVLLSGAVFDLLGKRRARRGAPATQAEADAYKATRDIAEETMATIRGIRRATDEKIVQLLLNDRDRPGGA